MFYHLLSSFFYLATSKNIEPVTELKLNEYLGHWLQVYESPTNIIFQGYGTCITADYGILENGNVSVLNTQLDENNKIEQISGYAYYKNVSEPGKLNVHLEGVPVDSPYWVVKLGEIKNEQYQYSIVTTPSYVSLWVLTRNVDDFFKYYNKEVVEYLETNNFKYVSVPQTDCY